MVLPSKQTHNSMEQNRDRSLATTRSWKGKEESSLRTFRKSMALLTSWFQTSNLQNCETIHTQAIWQHCLVDSCLTRSFKKKHLERSPLFSFPFNIIHYPFLFHNLVPWGDRISVNYSFGSFLNLRNSWLLESCFKKYILTAIPPQIYNNPILLFNKEIINPQISISSKASIQIFFSGDWVIACKAAQQCYQLKRNGHPEI